MHRILNEVIRLVAPKLGMYEDTASALFILISTLLLFIILEIYYAIKLRKGEDEVPIKNAMKMLAMLTLFLCAISGVLLLNSYLSNGGLFY